MLELEISTQFKKDLKLARKQHKDVIRLEKVISTLQEEMPLPEKYRDHLLSSNWQGYRECHIDPDWLLIYKVIKGHVRLLRLARLGSHSDLFK
jgi:mRNA interferase YafQ